MEDLNKQSITPPGPPLAPRDSVDPVAGSRVPDRSAQETLDFSPATAESQPASLADAPISFGRYQVRSVLGTGGFGTVYLGHDLELDRPVAIKARRPDKNMPKEEADRFLQEARRVARLRHPSIVTVHDVGVQEGQVYIVSAYIEGTSLRNWMNSNRPSWQEAARITAELADALAHAHAQLTVHRDVKPANIILTTDRVPVLVDFGLGIDETGKAGNELGMVSGTPAYMSPEQVAGEAHRIDGRTDIYSLGVVLYELLCGRQPFRATDPRELLRQVAHDEPQPPRQLVRDIPRELEKICLKAIAKRITDRHSTAGDFADELRRVLPGAAAIIIEPPLDATLVPEGHTAQAGELVKTPSSRRPLDVTPSAVRRAREAERRQLTVLFCDLANSAALAERIDPEDLHVVLRDYQKVCGEVVTRFGGEVVQSIGDGLLVCFGYPVAYEDAAQRAVRAGLGMIEDIARLSKRLQKSQDVSLSLRIGIHTGLAIAGEMSGGKPGEPLSIVGEARNVASELQAAAEPGTVVISPATERIVHGFFECQSLGARTIKGVTRPLELHRVMGERAVRSRIEVAGLAGLTPLVGRDREVGLLIDRWEQVKEAQGQVATIIGEPGIGKSRMLHAIREHVTAEHTGADPRLVIEWRCSPQHTNSSLNPASEFLDRHLQFRREESPDEKLGKLEGLLLRLHMPLLEVVPLFAALAAIPLPAKYPPLQLTPERLKQKTLDVLVDFLRRNADQQPVLFVVEDLHWIDASTIELLNMLVEESQGMRILVVFTFRPEFKPPWTGTHIHAVSLPRLNKKQVAEFLEKRTGSKSLPAEVAEQVALRTDGVPLFIEECTNMLLETGRLKEVDGQFVLTGKLTRDAIPSTLQDLLMARLDRLGTAKDIAQLGAALGREFTHELLQAVATHSVQPGSADRDDTSGRKASESDTGPILPTPRPGPSDLPDDSGISHAMDSKALDAELAKLLDAELLFKKGRPPQHSYIFKHALIQDAAYNSLLKSKRQKLHQRIGEVLEFQFPETAASQPELLAHHFTEAALKEKAVAYWEKAGLLCRERSANTEAIGHLNRGLQLLESFDDSPERTKQELRLQIPLGTALLSTKGYAAPEVGPVFTRARQLCEQIGDPSQLFAVMWGIWAWHVVIGNFRHCMDLAGEAMALAGKINNPGVTMEALFMPGLTMLYRADFAGAREHCGRAVSDFDDPEQCRIWAGHTGQNSGVTHRCYLSLALWHLGFPDQALAMNREMVTRAREVKHPFSLAYGLHHTGWLHQHMRMGPETQAAGEEEMNIAVEQGFLFWHATGTLYRAAGWLLQGRHDEALPDIRKGLNFYRSTGAGLAVPFYLSVLAQAFGKAGQLDEGLATVAEAFDVAHKNEDLFQEAEIHRIKGDLLLAKSAHNAEAAEACFHQALEIARRQQSKAWELRSTMSLARLWRDQGKRDEARQALQKIYDTYTEGHNTPDLMDAQKLLGELA